MKNWKRKVGIGAAGVALLVGGTATAAYALTDTVDNFGSYTSSPTGAVLDNSESGYNGIAWHYGYDQDISKPKADIYIRLRDVKADGNGPIAIVRKYGANGAFDTQRVFHNTKGNQMSQDFHDYFSLPPSNKPEDSGGITVQICNGVNSSGGYQNCGTVHGPFHAY